MRVACIDPAPIFFRSTSVFSALEVCYENALYKFTFDIDVLTLT